MNPRVERDHSIHQAVVTGDTAMVSAYLAEGGSPNITDRYDCEPNFTAVKYDRLEIAEMLLAAGGQIDRRSKFRGDAFGVACWNWNIRMIDFCLKVGVDINAMHNGKTILDSITEQKKMIHEDFPEPQAGSLQQTCRTWCEALK